MTAILSCGLATSSCNLCTRILLLYSLRSGKTILALVSTRFTEKTDPLEECQFHIITTPWNLPGADRRSVIPMATDPKSRRQCVGRIVPRHRRYVAKQWLRWEIEYILIIELEIWPIGQWVNSGRNSTIDPASNTLGSRARPNPGVSLLSPSLPLGLEKI